MRKTVKARCQGRRQYGVVLQMNFEQHGYDSDVRQVSDESTIGVACLTQSRRSL